MNTSKKHIGLIIKEIMDDKNLSVRIISEKMGLSRQAIYDLPKRKGMDLDEIAEWATALGVTVEEIQLRQHPDYLDKFPNLPDDYLMKYVAELEARIKEQSQQLDMQNETIRVLLGKSKASGLRLSRGVVGSKAPIFLRIPA